MMEDNIIKLQAVEKMSKKAYFLLPVVNIKIYSRCLQALNLVKREKFWIIERLERLDNVQ